MENNNLMLNSYTYKELEELFSSWGEPKYRAKQVFEWISRGVNPCNMTNIPKSLREKLDTLPFGTVEIVKRLVSQKDGTVKYLFKLFDGNLIEGVLMKYKYGNTLCISTQVGCNMGCAFCASTLEGCVRNLEAGEMLFEVLAVENEKEKDGQGDGQRRVTNIVLMGSGEPLDNYDNVVRFLKLVSAQDGICISQRNISLSTCGLVDKIKRLPDDGIHVTLSVSLHAPNNEIRSKLMPVNHAYPVETVLKAAKEYADKTGRRVIFEYSLIKGINDGKEQAAELAKRLRGINCHVNIIPLNSVKERNLTGTTRKEAQDFCKMLERMNISATVRREMGADIDGACGQLRRRVINEGGLE